MLPTFIIIGAQKSASSFVQLCLADHPDIYLPRGETPFFETPDYERGDITDLEAMFEGRPEKCLGIKRPNYIGRPEVPGRIQAQLPAAKLIAVLRNPIDRVVSAYFHNIKYGFIPPLDVEVGLRQLLLDDAFSAQYKRASEIIEFGYYDQYLRQYQYYLDNQQLLIFLHEDIVADPLSAMQQAYGFLGVTADFVPESLNTRPQKVLYSVPRLKLLCQRNKFLYDYNEDRTRLMPKSMTLVDKAASKGLDLLDKKLLSKYFPNQKPTLSPELRSLLYKRYADDIKALSTLIDRDLSAWNPSR